MIDEPARPDPAHLQSVDRLELDEVATPASGLIQSNLAVAGQRIEEELHRKRNKPVTMSQGAVEMLEALHGEYLGDLGQVSIRIARRQGLSTVDESHVLDASRSLGSSPTSTVVGNSLNTVGGVFSGAGLAGLYGVFFSARASEATTTEMVAATLLSLLGIALLSVGITLTFRPR